jgi:hypothetical protein
MRTNEANFYTGINSYLAGIPTYYRPWGVSIPLTIHPNPNLELVTPTQILMYSHTHNLPLTANRSKIISLYQALKPIMSYPVIWQDRDLDRYLVTESTAKKSIIDFLFTGDWQPRTKLDPLSTST